MCSSDLLKMRVIKDGGLVLGQTETALAEGTPIASSYQPSLVGPSMDHTAAKAFDGNDSTYWANSMPQANTTVEWVGVQYTSPKTITKISFKQGTGDNNYGCVSSVFLEYSSDGATWTLLDTLTFSATTDEVVHAITNRVSASYWRIRQNGAQVSHANPFPDPWAIRTMVLYDMSGTSTDPVEITSPYTYAELAELKFVQSADTLFLAHPDHPPYRLTRYAHWDWEFTPITFTVDTPFPSGLVGNYSRAVGATTRTMKYKVAAVMPNGEESLPSPTVEVTVDSPWYSGATVDLSWNEVTGATGYRVYKSSRGAYGLILDLANDTAKITGGTSIASSNSGTADNAFDNNSTTYWTPSPVSGSWIGKNFGSAKKVVKYRMRQGGSSSNYCTNSAILEYSSNGTDWNTLQTDSIPVTYQSWVEVTVKNPVSAQYWRVKNNDHRGYLKPLYWRVYELQFCNEGIPLDGTDDNIEPDILQGPQTEKNPFNSTGNYPGAVGLYQQRLMLARTDSNPQTIWASRTGNFASMAVASPPRDDDSIELTIDARQVNEIRHLVAMDQLLVFTSGTEWVLGSGSNSDAITPTSLKTKLQGYRGCSEVPPLVIGHAILYIQRNGAAVREMEYSLQVDGLATTDISVLSNHMFREHSIIEWAYQQTPDSVVWCVRDDGVMLGFTYLKEHEVWAWHRHTTNGTFESVCTIDGATQDDVYLVVKRHINGQDVRYIERMAPRLPGKSLVEGVFLDSSLTYRGTAADTISGLEHLEGETVNALADGNVVEDLTVTNGEITLPFEAAVVHVGLPYTADLETLRLEFDAGQGTMQGRKKQISKLTLRLESTRGLVAGPDVNNLTELKWRQGEDYNAPTDLFTGDKDLNISPRWNTVGRIFIRQTYPLPVTVLGVIPEVVVSER